VTAQRNQWELDKLVIQTEVTKKMTAEARLSRGLADFSYVYI
jgi:hypothetical protein